MNRHACLFSLWSLWLLLSAGCNPSPVRPMGSHGAHGYAHRARHEGAPLLHQDMGRFVAAMDDPRRAAWQKPDEVVAALGLRAGQVVADIGAGTGYFTFRLAKAVGDQGKVYAVDVDEKLLALLRQRKHAARAHQVEIVKTSPSEPGLAPASVDVAFLCDTYHHIGNRVVWLKKLKRALRPGGRLVNVDFVDGPLPVGPPDSHKLPEKQVREELARAGFKLAADLKLLPYQYILIYEPDPNR